MVERLAATAAAVATFAAAAAAADHAYRPVPRLSCRSPDKGRGTGTGTGGDAREPRLSEGQHPDAAAVSGEDQD